MKDRELLKRMTECAVMTALYVVLSMFVNIPIINKIVLELGYVVLGACCNFMEAWQLMFIGGVGCILKALLTGGSFPLGWFPSQLLLGYLLSKIRKMPKLWMKILCGAVMTYLCIGIVKTMIEVPLFHLPLWAKLGSNSVAALTDMMALGIGILLTCKYRFR